MTRKESTLWILRENEDLIAEQIVNQQLMCLFRLTAIMRFIVFTIIFFGYIV